MSNKLIFITQETAETRIETMDGIEYLVAPVIAVVAGVLNGELLPADVIEESVQFWEDVPIPVNHPTVYGANVSAKQLEQIKNDVVGRFYNARFEDDSLKGEMWIDIAKATEMGGEALEVLEKLQDGDVVEVSTAYFAKVTKMKGNVDGKKYNGVQSNIRPDHLALLPNKVGACSVADGCGANRVNEVVDLAECACTLKVQLQDGESVSDRREAVQDVIGDAWIVDLYETEVIVETYGIGDIGYMKVEYTMKDGVATVGSMVQVEREVSYKETPISNESVIKRIAAFAGDKLSQVKHLLEVPKMNEEKIVTLEGEETIQDDVVADAVVTEEAKENAEVDANVVKFNEYLEANGLDVTEVLATLKANEEAKVSEKQGLVDGLKANENCTISDESLEAMDVSALNELSAAFKPGTYLGALVPNSATTVPVAPSIMLNEVKDGE